MPALETLAGRLRTTGEIQSIVRTMKALSSASIRQYEEAVAAMTDYERTVSLGLQILLRDRLAGARPDAATAGVSGLIVLGSDRGLCGQFNERIGRAALDRLAADRPQRLCVAGRRLASRLGAEGHRPDTILSLPGSVGGLVPVVHALAVQIDRWTAGAEGGRVSILFNRRTGPTAAEPTYMPVLPVQQDELDALARTPWPSRRLPIYRMDRARLLSWLAGQRIFVLLYRALAESLASEHAARRSAMQRAERNIGEHREGLMNAYRQKRQEAITRELLDILAGFEALGAAPEAGP